MFLRGGSSWAYTDEMEGGGEVYVRLDGEGRVVELYLTKSGDEITPADLRRLPLVRMRAQARARPDLWYMAESDPDLRADVHAEVRRAFPSTWIEDRPRQEPPFELSPSAPAEGLTDPFLQDVATAYRDAVSRGLRPNIALAQQTQHEKRTVEKWVYLARKKGFLEPTKPGRVG